MPTEFFRAFTHFQSCLSTFGPRSLVSLPAAWTTHETSLQAIFGNQPTVSRLLPFWLLQSPAIMATLLRSARSLMHTICRGARRGKGKFFFWVSLPGREFSRNATAYPCIFPQCETEAQFPNEALLEKHMAGHFGLSLEDSSAGGALSRSSNQTPGDCHEAIDVTPGFTPSARPSVPQEGNDLHWPTTQHEIKVDVDTGSIPNRSANAKKKHLCRGRGCNMSFNRYNDRERHEETHYTTGKIKFFECPELGCNRKGEWGFNRRDKIVDHIRAKHKRSVGRNEFRNGYLRYSEERGNWLATNGFDLWGEPIKDFSK